MLLTPPLGVRFRHTCSTLAPLRTIPFVRVTSVAPCPTVKRTLPVHRDEHLLGLLALHCPKKRPQHGYGCLHLVCSRHLVTEHAVGVRTSYLSEAHTFLELVQDFSVLLVDRHPCTYARTLRPRASKTGVSFSIEESSGPRQVFSGPQVSPLLSPEPGIR